MPAVHTVHRFDNFKTYDRIIITSFTYDRCNIMTNSKTTRRKSRRVSFVVPETMIQEFEAQCRADDRLLSEGLRDAMRLYLRTALPQRAIVEPIKRRVYTEEELAQVAETLETDTAFESLRGEAALWDRTTAMDGLTEANR